MKNDQVIPTTFSEALRLASDLQRKVEELQASRLADASSAEFSMEAVDRANNLPLHLYAKTLTEATKREFTEHEVEDALRMLGYLSRGDDGVPRNQPYQRYVSSGLFRLRYLCDVRKVQHVQVLVTGEGQVHLLSAIRDTLDKTQKR